MHAGSKEAVIYTEDCANYAAFFIFCFLCPVPDLVDLVSELQDVSDWIPFGVWLGIRSPKLEAIRRNCQTIEECRIEMLNTWLIMVRTPTWSAVVQALEKIGMPRLADEIAHKYG